MARRMNTSSLTITPQFTRKCLRRVAIARLASIAVMYSWDIMIRPTYSPCVPVSRLVNTITAIYMMSVRPSLRATRGGNRFLFQQVQINVTSLVQHNVYGSYFVY